MFVEQLRSTPPTKGGSFSRTASGFSKVQSSTETRLFERRAMKQRVRARHLRFVEPSPPTRAVPHNSSPTVLLFSKKPSNIASTQINGVLLSSCDRHRQPKLIVFESCFRFLKIQSSPATKLFERRCHEATNKSTTPACLSSHPHRRELFPTARRQPFYCFRRSSPTLLQPRSTECC